MLTDIGSDLFPETFAEFEREWGDEPTVFTEIEPDMRALEQERQDFIAIAGFLCAVAGGTL